MCDRVTTISCGVIRSSMLMSPPNGSISERRLSPYCSFTAVSSSWMIWLMRSGRARMSIRSRMVSMISRYSPTILSCSSPVRRCKRKSRIAWACTSDRR
ncbi:hypothetical protein D3C85_1664270 [compost metagenome]